MISPIGVYGGLLDPSAISATMAGVGLELRYSGTPSGPATLRYRAEDGPWVEGKPLWNVPAPTDGGGPAFYGSLVSADPSLAMGLRPDSSYAFEVAVDGQTIRGLAHTRAEPAPVDAPTHYVRAGGSDAADGTTEATAWATFDHMWSVAPAGAVVQFGPGLWTRSTPYSSPNSQNGRTAPIALVAQYPAVDDGGNLVNDGLQTILTTGRRTQPGSGAWSRVVQSGVTFWRYAGGRDGITTLCYSTSDTAELYRVAPWKRDGLELATPTAAMALIATNRSYNYGFWVDANGDVYLRLYGDTDPNTLVISMSDGSFDAFFQAADCRLSGFRIRARQYGMVAKSCARPIVDHCSFEGCVFPTYFSNPIPSSPSQSTYGTDAVVEHNRFTDRNLRDPNGAAQTNTGVIPWALVKGNWLVRADGTVYPTRRIAGAIEGAPIHGRGFFKRTTFRYNLVDGMFNGHAIGSNTSFDRYAGSDMDVYRNTLRNIADDALEPEAQCINLRAWDNVIERSLTILSTGPATYGPIYLRDNVAWQWGTRGEGAYGAGYTLGSTGLKYSGSSVPNARVSIDGDRYWSDDPTAGLGDQWASPGSSQETFVMDDVRAHAAGPGLTRRDPARFSETGCDWDASFDAWLTR